MAKQGATAEQEKQVNHMDSKKKYAGKSCHGSTPFFVFLDYLFLGIFFCFLGYILIRMGRIF